MILSKTTLSIISLLCTLKTSAGSYNLNQDADNLEHYSSFAKTKHNLVKRSSEQNAVPDSKAPSLLNSTNIHYDARDVTYFLESHPAHSAYDPRCYFTEERTTRSFAILSHELSGLPERLRFAYVVRVFNELGRKIASKLNYYSTEVAAILRKTPDDLGNKPEVSMLVDAVHSAFESKQDNDPKEESEENQVSEKPISSLIGNDKEKAAVFDSSLAEISTRLAQKLSYFISQATKTDLKVPSQLHDGMISLLGESLKMGAKTMVEELSKNDKFKIPQEIVEYASRILNMSVTILKQTKENDSKIPDEVVKAFGAPDVKSFKDLNPISDKTGLIGPWNNYLFSNLGTSERVVKLFAALLKRVPPEVKSRWINMYMSQVYIEIERTLSGFVVMQGMPHKNDSSESFLLDPARSVDIMPVKLPKPRAQYAADKNRIPARCYLAGRRWRLILMRSLEGFIGKDEVLKQFADKFGEFKIKMVKKSGNEIYRLCMPRVEVGLRGWGINGDPQADGGQSSKFPLKNPIQNLDKMNDPFINGAKMGFKLGVKVGYNEERNASLELELTSHGKGDLREQIGTETKFLAKACYRRAATIGARKAFEIAVRQGYIMTLKVSVRAGLQIPIEAASRLSALRCVSFAGQAGLETGRAIVDAYFVNKRMPENVRKSLLKVGEAHGLLAGEIMGKTIGAVVGKEAAEEAYRRTIVRGGKISRAKFNLEEYVAGATLAFDVGLKEGKRIASSSSLDPSAPRFFRFNLPVFSSIDKVDNEVDHWEKDLIPPLSTKIIEDIQDARNHTTVTGSLRGFYKVAKETKKGLDRVAYSNITYTLEVFANGFIKDNIAYLTLNGTVNNMGPLKGSLIARDIFNDKGD